jgi:hypothetical protein
MVEEFIMEILKVGIIINLIKNLLRVFASILIVLVVSACGSTNSSMPSTRVTNTPQESVESSILSGSQERIIKVPVSETESFIESSLLQKAGAITKVTCPARMEGQIGDFFECLVENLTIPSDSHFADVQIMNELGEISYVVRRD